MQLNSPKSLYHCAINEVKERLPASLEEIIGQDAKYSYHYAVNIIKGRFPAGEAAISQSKYAYKYAYDIIKDQWIEGEAVIAKSANASYDYAVGVLRKQRFPEGELEISKSAFFSYFYAKNVIKERWIPGDNAILESEFRHRYLKLFKTDELVEYFEIDSKELLILKLKYNDEDIRKYILVNFGNHRT